MLFGKSKRRPKDPTRPEAQPKGPVAAAPKRRIPLAVKRRELKRMQMWQWVSVTLVIIGCAFFAYAPIAQAITTQQLASQTEQRTESKPTAEQDAAYEKAVEYNRKLAASGQRILGEAVDPFVAANDPNAQPVSKTDQDYNSQLNIYNDGVMGSISIPKISVKLPIYHGTALEELERGAGHMYGTSLPVGGENTHAIISAHTGMSDKLMFTRLDELKEGDVFYVHAAGRTLAYKINEINVILPNDFSKIPIRQGKDIVTLMTCTPIGKNTHRLLVTGERAEMPQVVPYEEDAPQDPNQWNGLYRAAGAGAGGLLYAGYTAFKCHRQNKLLPKPMRHKAGRGRR